MTQTDLKVRNWNACRKGYLRGFATVELSNGLILHDLALFEKTVNGVTQYWLNMPAREWTDQAGITQYQPLISFNDPSTRDRFRDAVVPSILRYLDRQKEAQESMSERLRANSS